MRRDADHVCGGVPFGNPQPFVRANGTLYFYDTRFSRSRVRTASSTGCERWIADDAFRSLLPGSLLPCSTAAATRYA